MTRPTFNIDGASYNNKSFSFATQTTDAGGIAFKSDGTKMYLSNFTSIYQYSLSTAWDVSTATYDNVTKNYSSYGPSGIFFKDDGTRMFFTDRNSQYVYQFNLTTARDLSSSPATYTSRLAPGKGNFLFGLFFKPDGTKFYFLVGNTIYQYSTSTAWTLTGSTYDNKSFSGSTQDSGCRGFWFNDTGTKLFIEGNTNKNIYQYSLSTARDISTASYDSKSFSFSTQVGVAQGLCFKNDDGGKFYITDDTNNSVYEYLSYVTATPTGAAFLYNFI